MVHLRTALLWAITQQIVVISYWRFRTTYQSHHEQRNLEDGTDRLSWNISKKLPLLTAQ